MPKRNRVFAKTILRVLGRGPISFVQVGAFDGIDGDPIRDLILRHQWKGMLVEPLPEAFKKLVENYKDVQGLIFENVAIHHYKTEVELLVMNKNLSCTTRHADNKNMNKYKEFGLRTVKQTAVRLDALLHKHGFYNVDLLQVDTEGDDWDVIRSLDFSICKPCIIHYEHKHLGNRLKPCSEYLSSHGYNVRQESKVDTIAILRSA